MTQSIQQTPHPIQNSRTRILVAAVILLATIFVIGIRWILIIPSEAIGSAPFQLFNFAVGLTMIFLPCTLPLAFVIVPLAMSKSAARGVGMALSFGAGVAITLGFYGMLIGFLGHLLGINQVETAKNILYTLAGILAISFALGDLGLIRFRAPTMNIAIPQFILRQSDVLKAGLMGLLLGNVGVGCPNPLFNAIIIPSIIATGSAIEGWFTMIVQALGRVTPLLILAFLAILGINSTNFLVKNRKIVEHLTGWVTVFIGGFLIVLGFFGHDWWVLSGQHTAWEMITQENFITKLLGGKLGELGHTHGIEGLRQTGLFGVPIQLGTSILLFLWIAPMFWYWQKRRKTAGPEEVREIKILFWFFVMFAGLLIAVFGWILPHQFISHWSKVEHHEAPILMHLSLETNPRPAFSKQPFELILTLHDQKGNVITNFRKTHERFLHLILISEDLKIFKHLHPDDDPKAAIEDMLRSGVFRIPILLEKSGKYRVIVDAAPEGKEASALAWLNIEGEKQPVIIEKDLDREKEFGGYFVKLDIDPEELKSGEESHLKFSIFKDGIQIRNIPKYLGADMHLIIVSADLSYGIHTHGELQNGIIDAHIVFPFPGIWKVFAEFMAENGPVLTEFILEVSPENLNMISQPHSH